MPGHAVYMSWNACSKRKEQKVDRDRNQNAVFTPCDDSNYIIIIIIIIIK
jgi:hypothetical protein